MLSDDLKCFSFFLQKCLKFCLSFSIELKHITLYFFLAVLLFVFEILRMQKNLCFLSRQQMTPKRVISLKIQQNIDLSQRAALTKFNVDFR